MDNRIDAADNLGDNIEKSAFRLVELSGDTVALPDGFSPVNAEYSRVGSNLVMTAPDGESVVVRGYFESANPPDLVGANGARVPGDLAVRLAGPVAPRPLAENGPLVSARPIGQVENVEGTVTAIRADGMRIELKVGDPVYQGDILESGADGSIGIVLADETTFSMGRDGRMVLDEMVYDPTTREGSVSVSVMTGVFVFVSGHVAKTDPDAMTLTTPMGTVGIRGTQVGLDISESGEIAVVLMEEADGFVGEVFIMNDGGVTVLNGASQFLSLDSHVGAHSEITTISDPEIIERFSLPLKSLPIIRGNENDFGLQGDESPNELEEALNEFETASGEDTDAQVFGDIDDPSAEGLNDFDTAAGGEQGGGDVNVVDGTFGATQDEAVDEAQATFEAADGDDAAVDNIGDPVTFSDGSGIGAPEIDGIPTPTPPSPGPGTEPPSTSVSTSDPASTPEPVSNVGPELADSAAAGTEDDGAIAGQLQLTDPDGPDATYALVGSQPTNGTVTINADGSYFFVPNNDFSGVATFDVQVDDGLGATDTATVTITVDPDADAPTLRVLDAAGLEDAGIALDVSAALSDTDGSETLSVTISDIPAGASLSYVDGNAATRPIPVSDGTASLSADQLNGLTITPPTDSDANFSLTVAATATESDGGTATTEATVAVDVEAVADAPTLTLSIGEPTEVAGGAGVSGSITTNNVMDTGAGFAVAGRKINADHSLSEASADNISIESQGFGVSGVNDGPDAQLGLDADAGVSEQLIVDFDGVVSEATISIARLFANEGGTGFDETGAYTLHKDGVEVGTATFTAESGHETSLNIAVDGGFDRIVFEARDFEAGHRDGADAGDYLISQIDFTTMDDAGGLRYPVDIATALADTDGSETLSIVVAGVPDGAALSAGTNNGDGTWSLALDEVAGLSLFVPTSADVDQFTLTVASTSTEARDDGDSASVAASESVVVDEGAGAPDLTVSDTGGDEDTAIALNIGASLADVNESLSVTIGGVPDGAALSAGVDNNDGTWTLSADQLNGLTITPPANSGDDFQLTVTATSTDLMDDGTTSTATTTGMIDVGVIGVADAPTLSVLNAAGLEDAGIALDVSAALSDTDGSETLSVTISDIPAGASLSYVDGNAATRPIPVSGGTASLSADQLNGLTITPPADSDANFSLTVAATATESDGGTATTEATVAVDVEAVADAPTLTVELGNGVENPWFDAKVTVTNKGDHSAGYHNSYGYYVMDENGNPTEGRVIWADQHAAADDAAYDIEGIDPDKVGFFLIPNGDNLNDSIVDGMAVTFTRNSEGDWVVVDPSGHELEGKGAPALFSDPSLNKDGFDYAKDTGAPGNQNWEDLPGGGDRDYNDVNVHVHRTTGVGAIEYPLIIAAELTDVDGSESLSIVVFDLPEGAALSAGMDNGDGGWTLGADDLDGLTLTVPEGTDGFDLTVAATATESDGDTAETTSTVDINGNDAMDGDDTLYGGRGSDAMDGGDGEDVLYGGRGNDTMDGDDGDDTLYGGRGKDTMDGDDGDDVLYGGRGNDAMDGGDGEDVLYGGRGKDAMDGGDGEDVLYGGRGKDAMDGGDGEDVLYGGRGKDTMDGGDGDDTLYGGRHDDILTGGGGQDTFIFDAESGKDIVTDIMDGDKLIFEGEEFDANDLIFKENKDGDVVVSFTGQDTEVTLEGVSMDDIRHDGGDEGYSVSKSKDSVTITVDAV